MADELRRQITLACPPGHAFRVFVEQVDLWWPRGHRRFRDGALRFDADRLVDRAADGTEWTMAEIVERSPPLHLRLAWYPGSSNAPTDVDIGFAAVPSGTLVTIVHRPSMAGAGIWAARVATFDAGWTATLAALAGFVSAEMEQS